ncbi:MAG: hypothetical protein ACKOYN_00735 [Planctomycetota bacterium]
MASVLAMMFLVIFASLAAAMAVVAQGNLRTADSALKVSRAQSAAESGLVFAARRLAKEGTRFVIREGFVTNELAERIWKGPLPLSAEVEPAEGYVSDATTLAEAIHDANLADASAFAPIPAEHDGLPSIDPDTGLVIAAPLRIDPGVDRLWFQLTYEPVFDEGDPNTTADDRLRVRVTSLGVDGGIRRTLSLDFDILKRIEYAVISPNRIMIGKNVMIEGPLGSRYGINAAELAGENGHPLVMRSDFRYINSSLTAKVDAIALAAGTHDTDGDGRLRVNHPLEQQGVSQTVGDLNGDEYVDEFDAFLSEFDANGDGRVTWNTPNPNEFDGDDGEPIDAQLARLMDRALADRNGDGLFDAFDVQLGYDDGVLDSRDYYAKVNGKLVFAVEEAAWESAAQENWRNIAQGSVRAPKDEAPARFEVGTDELRAIETSQFASQATAFRQLAQSAILPTTASGYTPVDPTKPATRTVPATYEEVPYRSPAPYEYFQRPTYENIVFGDVFIPKGTNALFKNCRFEGIVYVETTFDCDDPNWNYTGALREVDQGGGVVTYVPRFPGIVSQSDGIGSSISNTRNLSNSLRFDGCTFLGSIAGDTPREFTHWRNKIQITGPTRFFSDPNDPELQTAELAPLRDIMLGYSDAKLDLIQRSSILMPGWSVDVGNFRNELETDPNGGSSLYRPRVNLKGTCVAGVLDIRGTADVLGTLLMTFRPIPGQGALYYNGQPALFNTTLGYFGPLDGDGEGQTPDQAGFDGYGEIRLRYDPNAKLPDGIPWPITVEPKSNSYREGGLG